MCNHFNIPIASLRDLNGITEVSYSPIDLDLIVEEFLERRDIEDLVIGWLGGVDDILQIYENQDSCGSEFSNLFGDLLRLAFGSGAGIFLWQVKKISLLLEVLPRARESGQQSDQAVDVLLQVP